MPNRIITWVGETSVDYDTTSAMLPVYRNEFLHQVCSERCMYLLKFYIAPFKELMKS